MDQAVWTHLEAYANFLFLSNYCSAERAVEKYREMIKHLYSLDDPICVNRPSTHFSFGGREGYLLSRYNDSKSGTQWAFTYERFDTPEGIKVVVHDMRLASNIVD